MSDNLAARVAALEEKHAALDLALWATQTALAALLKVTGDHAKQPSGFPTRHDQLLTLREEDWRRAAPAAKNAAGCLARADAIAVVRGGIAAALMSMGPQ